MIGPGRQMHHEGVPSAARASAHRLLEVGSAAHPVRSGQHRRWCQAESSARPLRRRAARIARPARVRIRRRKPWVLARRRLFGWKVRLLTRVSKTSGGPRMCRATRFRLPRSNCSQDTHRVRAASGRASRGHREGCNTVLPAVLAGQMRATRRIDPPTRRAPSEEHAASGLHPGRPSPRPSPATTIGLRRPEARPVDHDVVDGRQERRPPPPGRRPTGGPHRV